jgi:hypothetical protein
LNKLIIFIKEEKMKKRLFGLLCLMVLMACNYQVPESLVIRGSPTVKLPLGNPFNLLDDNERLEYYVSLDGIREMMNKNGADGKVNIYNYNAADYQTYVVHYPLAKMQLNLTEYIDEKLAEALNDVNGEQIDINVPTEPPTFPDLPPGSSIYPYYLTPTGPVKSEEPLPLYNVELDDMYKLILEVEGKEEGNSFGIEIPDGALFQEHLWVKIPAFGIKDYMLGKMEGDKLRFISDEKTFYPHDMEDGILKAYFMVTGPCPGIRMPEIVFNWEKALIDSTTSNFFNGDYTIENALGKYMGVGVEFTDVQGYIYIEGVDGSATLSLTVESSESASPVYSIDDEPLANQATPDFSASNYSLAPQSLNAPIPLADMLNSPGDSVTLSYKIKIEEYWVYAEDISGLPITTDMVILLPLKFKATTPSDYTGKDGEEYVKISLNDLLPDSSEGDDLFMRDKGEDSLLKDISYIRIALNHYKNTILKAEELGVLITAKYKDESDPYLNYFSMTGNAPFLQIDKIDKLPNPFNPGFDVLVKKEKKSDGNGYEDYAMLGIFPQNKNSAFSFTIMAEVKTNINQSINTINQ